MRKEDKFGANVKIYQKVGNFKTVINFYKNFRISKWCF